MDLVAIINAHQTCGLRECDKPGTLFCSLCRHIRYCSSACQKIDWKLRHKEECAKIVKLTKSSDCNAIIEDLQQMNETIYSQNEKFSDRWRLTQESIIALYDIILGHPGKDFVRLGFSVYKANALCEILRHDFCRKMREKAVAEMQFDIDRVTEALTVSETLRSDAAVDKLTLHYDVDADIVNCRLITILSRIDLLRCQSCDYEVQVESRKALEMVQTIPTSNKHRVDLLMRTGLVLKLNGDLTNARALFESAYCAIAEKDGPADPELQTITNNLADILKDLGDYDAAEFYCRTALENLQIHCEEEREHRGVSMMMLSSSLADILMKKTVSKGENNLQKANETTAAILDEAEELYKFTLTYPDHNIIALQNLNRLYIMRKKRGPDVEASLNKEIELRLADSRQVYVVTSTAMRQLCQYLEDGLLGGTAESTTSLSPEELCEGALKLRDSLMNLIGNTWLEFRKVFDHPLINSTRRRLDECAYQYIESGMLTSALKTTNEQVDIEAHCAAVDSLVDSWIQLPASPVTPPVPEFTVADRAVLHDLQLASLYFSAGVALMRLASEGRAKLKETPATEPQSATNNDFAHYDAKIKPIDNEDSHTDLVSAIVHVETTPSAEPKVIGPETSSEQPPEECCDNYCMKAAELFKQALVLFDLHLGEAKWHSFCCVDRITHLASITLQFVESSDGVWMEYFDRAIDYWRTKCDEFGGSKPNNENDNALYRDARYNLAQALRRSGNFWHHQALYFGFIEVHNKSTMCIEGTALPVRKFAAEISIDSGNTTDSKKGVKGRSKLGRKKKGKKNRYGHNNNNVKANEAAAPKSVCRAEGIDVCRTAYKRLINEMIEILLSLDFKEDHVDIHRYRLELSKIDDDFSTIFTSP